MIRSIFTSPFFASVTLAPLPSPASPLLAAAPEPTLAGPASELPVPPLPVPNPLLVLLFFDDFFDALRFFVALPAPPAGLPTVSLSLRPPGDGALAAGGAALAPVPGASGGAPDDIFEGGMRGG